MRKYIILAISVLILFSLAFYSINMTGFFSKKITIEENSKPTQPMTNPFNVVGSSESKPISQIVTKTLRCPDSCDDGDKCTRDYCSKATNYECKHDKIEPCEGNGICEVGENPFLAYSLEEAVKTRAVQTTKLNYKLDCPETCSDNDDTTIDYYNVTLQKCIHFFKNVYSPRETIKLFGENRWLEIQSFAIDGVKNTYPSINYCSLGAHDTFYYKNENYWKVKVKVTCQRETRFSYEEFIVNIDENTGNVLNVEKIS